MVMKKCRIAIGFCIIFLTSLTSCKENCENQSCFTAPSNLVLNLVAASTGENLFTSETFSKSEISVTNTQNGTPIIFDFTSNTATTLLEIGDIGWQTETVQAAINVGKEKTINIRVAAERITEDCCQFTQYNGVVVENAVVQLDSDTGVYTVFVE